MDIWTVLLGGDVVPTERLKRQVAGTRVIAADSGMRHAEPLGLTPELWVGDFDSTEQDVDTPRKTYPAAKNMTDGALAIGEALDAGAGRMNLVGVFGGRTDHSVSHLLQALALHNDGVSVLMSSGAEEGVFLSAEALQPDWPDGTTFSVLPFAPLNGLTLTGCRWPLDEVQVLPSDTLTLSNIANTDLAMSVMSGAAVAVAQL